MNDLVSIVMLSHNDGGYLKESVESVLAQTYTNWELIFLDNSSTDGTISQMMKYKEKDPRFIIGQMVFSRGKSYNLYTALRSTTGRWMAFLNSKDVWEPQKLEKQIRFMEEHDYFFSYHNYRLMDKSSKDNGREMTGKDVINRHDLKKCCWMGYLTVMFDKTKVSIPPREKIKFNNNYALWLDVAEHADCHLLDECLGSMRTVSSATGSFSLKGKFRWRYEVYRVVERMGPLMSLIMTYRNFYYTLVRNLKYTRRIA